jgi:DNA polymerase-3 subunit alpha
MGEVEAKLRAGMARQGIEGAAAETIVRSITSFALYGFPECVVGETRVIDADTGRWVPIADVVQGRVRLESTLACDAEMKIRKRRVLKATASGRRMVYRVRTALGREITATAEHPLLTMDGWRAIAGLRVGDHIAAARALPTLGRKRWPRHELIVLADLIAEGNLCHPSTFYFYTTDPQHRDEFVTAVERFDNTRATVARHRSCYSLHVRRRSASRPAGAIQWAKRLGIWGHNARQKYLPEEVFELCATDLALLLARLWEGDGSMSQSGHASYDTASRHLAEDVQHLLLRLGIVSRLYVRTHPYRGHRVVSFVVTITGGENLRRFCARIARRFLDQKKLLQAMSLITPHTGGRRASRDVVPVGVKAVIDRERRRRGALWDDVGRGAGVALRAIVSPAGSKRGYRRWVIARLGRYFDSPELAQLASSDLYWDRIVAIEAIGERETFDLHIEGDHNFLANDLVVHNSHASSFALLAYASAYLKVHHPAAFYAALLNNQPMGFYHPATIVKDAQRHGLRFLQIDVTRSQWLCTVVDFNSDRPAEQPSPRFPRGTGVAKSESPCPVQSVRLGLRYVKGLREAAARALVQAREARPFASVHDLALRAALARDELETLAVIGALAPLGAKRRASLWAAAVPHPGPLFAGAEGEAPPSPLKEMTEGERLIADYGGTGVTLGRHPMAMCRAELDRRGVLAARALAAVPHGTPVRVAGSVIVRQRPGTAKGFVFLTLEDETGIANVIVTPPLFARYRLTLVTAPFLLVEGIAQQQDGVASVRAARVSALSVLARGVPSHDFG